MTTKDTRVHEGGPTSLPTLGCPILKAQIVAEPYRLTSERKLTQQQAGTLMGISQPGSLLRSAKRRRAECRADSCMNTSDQFLSAYGQTDKDLSLIRDSTLVRNIVILQSIAQIDFAVVRRIVIRRHDRQGGVLCLRLQHALRAAGAVSAAIKTAIRLNTPLLRRKSDASKRGQQLWPNDPL
jgi:hypothetical protein